MPIIATHTECNPDESANWQIELIQNLLAKSTLDHDNRWNIELKLIDINSDEAQRLIDYLYQNQLDPITSGLPYGQGDIKRHLKLLR